jgi:hypothetical protein
MKKDSFFERYLKLREEVKEKYGIKRPDPVAVLTHYLYTCTEIKEPRAIHRLLEVPLDRILDRLCKMGFITLPPKSIFAKKRARTTQFTPGVSGESIVPISDAEKTDEEKLIDFMLQ